MASYSPSPLTRHSTSKPAERSTDATLRRLTENLSERDRRVLTLRYAGDLSQSEIGRRIGVSQMQVSRILRRAIAELQEAASTDAAA